MIPIKHLDETLGSLQEVVDSLQPQTKKTKFYEGDRIVTVYDGYYRVGTIELLANFKMVGNRAPSIQNYRPDRVTPTYYIDFSEFWKENRPRTFEDIPENEIIPLDYYGDSLADAPLDVVFGSLYAHHHNFAMLAKNNKAIEEGVVMGIFGLLEPDVPSYESEFTSRMNMSFEEFCAQEYAKAVSKKRSGQRPDGTRSKKSK